MLNTQGFKLATPTSPTSSITHVTGGFYELRLQGRFTHPHWVAFLFTGLAESQVSVLSGRAWRDDNQSWEARLKLDFQRSAAHPEHLDYLALAQRKPSSIDTQMPRLSNFQIVRRSDGLEVSLQGPDQIGFLSRLLNRVSLLTLFPIEIEINTIAGQIKDRIVLQGIGGVVPNQDIQQSLRTALSGLVTSG